MSLHAYDTAREARRKRAEPIASAFHAEYERQAPLHGYETRKASAVPWEQVPEANKELMIGVVLALLDRRVIHTDERAETLQRELDRIRNALRTLRTVS